MFFVFSKVLAFFAQPLAVIGLLFVASWIIRNQRWKKILRISGFVIFFVTSNGIIADFVMHSWEVPVTPYASITKKYDYAVLLTGVTKTSMKPKDRVYFNRGADRATHSLQLYKLGIVKKILISGGSGRLDGGGILEADDLVSFFELAGVPREDIVIENKSQNTHESAVYVKEMLSKMDSPKELLLVTSGYHLPRAIRCFRKVGINADMFAAEPLTGEKGDFNVVLLIVPSLEAVGWWQTVIREWVGFVAYWFAGYI